MTIATLVTYGDIRDELFVTFSVGVHIYLSCCHLHSQVKKYNFDMMELTSEKDGLYCSVHCLKNCGKRITPRPTGKATKSVPLRSVYVPKIANKFCLWAFKAQRRGQKQKTVRMSGHRPLQSYNCMYT